MTGDAVRWTQVLKDGGCNPGCEGSPSSSQISETSTHSPGVGRDSSEHSHEPQASLYPGRKPQQQPQRMHHRRQPFLLSLKKILPIVLRLLSHCQTSTKRLCRSTASAMSSVAMTASSFHSSSPRAGSTRRGFYTSLLIVFQVVAFSSSFVIVSAHAATDDLSTSIKDNDAIGAQTSVFGEFAGGHHDYEDGDSFAGHYTPTWAVHIPEGDIDGKADQVARDHGFINLGKIFDDHYHFHHNSVSKRSVEESHHHQKRLVDDDRVRWSKQQQIKSRKKRDFIRMRPSRTSSVSRVELNDPKWPQMWYLNRGNGLDMNVIPAWEQGITGKGVVVTILDDGLESDHPDLEHNYDPKASYDVNSHDDDPMPHYDMTDSNRHGTRCAGEVAATANNSLCSVGIAFGARVGGVRMLDGDVTDAVEARSLSLNPQHIDIYSASWGPDDDGKTVDGPGELATRAFIEGVTKGRNGRGSIFIWASGNGGRELDNCNCDGYTNSIWTLSISSATEEGHVPWYSEKCSSTLATTYSSGGQNEKQVVTTDLHHSCTTSHTGTSASAPLAAGIVALVLEANRNLTWRDLQHIVVRTAKPGNLKDPTWITNGVGRRVSHSFGYGLLDAAGMVNLARTWQMVPEQQRCEINAPHVEQMIPAKRYITLQLTVKHCMGVNFLEHVQAKISLTSQRRGDIVIYLQSPSGTRVTLLTSRVHDVSRSGFNEWPFMSVHTWGEAPHGNWLLEVHNEGRFLAQITQWDLIFYGTDKPPQPDDPIQIKPGPFGSYGGDIDNNFLVPETMGQWRDLQQVGESHVDVQRTTNDQTNTACTNFLADQRCIECMQGTFLYNDRCWTHCPEQSYMVPEVPRNFNKDKNNDDDYENLISVRSISNTKETGSEPSPPRRAIMKPIPQKKCASCHTSCLLCRGPEAFECLQCHPGYHLTIISSDETYCYPATNGNNLSRATGQLSVSEEEETENILDELKAFWSVVVPALVIMLVVLGLSITSKQIIKRCKRRKDHPYERVAFEIPHEEVQGFNKPELHQPMRHKRECPDPSVSSEKRILVETSSDSDDC